MSDLGAFWIACGIALGLAIYGKCLEDGIEALAEAIKETFREYEE